MSRNGGDSKPQFVIAKLKEQLLVDSELQVTMMGVRAWNTYAICGSGHIEGRRSPLGHPNGRLSL